MGQEKKDIKVGKQISLEGIVKAIFGDAAHIQIGNKIIVVNLKNLHT